jgi:hypothetical protein
MLSVIHSHPRDSRISFDEPTHTYSIDGVSKNIMSVTTLIHKHFPHFNADKVIDKLIENGSEKYKGLSKDEIKKEWDENGKKASERGTALHKQIELFYNGYEIDTYSTEFLYFLQFHETIKDRLLPYRTEWSIFRKDLLLAGQLDMLYKIKDTDQYALYDWKCVKEIKFENKYEKGNKLLSHLDHCNYSHYSIQLSIYKRILETLYEIKISEMCLVILHSENHTFKVIPVIDMKSEIDIIFRDRKKIVNNKND